MSSGNVRKCLIDALGVSLRHRYSSLKETFATQPLGQTYTSIRCNIEPTCQQFKLFLLFALKRYHTRAQVFFIRTLEIDDFVFLDFQHACRQR
ncbi:hypothetical protein DFR42_101505 [Undibacterium pigrum]|uniref:Uncharacterized protein n=1 Tax=Undibacterium pigrum TaxID=401470 RepID=A0A318JHQ7_9BURK|nr:hypothetical protein DFR42_101505 [Undibacterium pigrum]